MVHFVYKKKLGQHLPSFLALNFSVLKHHLLHQLLVLELELNVRYLKHHLLHLLQELELSVRCLKRHLLRQLLEQHHLRLLNVGQLFVSTNLTMV